MKFELNIYKPNDAWVLHREEINTLQDGSCNIYVLLDAFSTFCFGQQTSIGLLEPPVALNLLREAHNQTGQWPKQVLISKSDPLVETLRIICHDLNLKFAGIPKKELKKFVKPFSDEFKRVIQGMPSGDELSESEEEELEAFVPETYGSCPCASGKKFKYCCQKIFEDIAFAMYAAEEEGDLNKALKHMEQAEKEVGITAEILCRYAICWSYFDRKKSQQYLAEAIKTNPNHPRANYILGIEAKQNKKYNEAIAYYKKAIDNYPKEDKFHLNETYNNLGSAYYDCGNFGDAKGAWEKALVLLPSDRMVRNNLTACIYENPDVPIELRKVSPFIERYLSRWTNGAFE